MKTYNIVVNTSNEKYVVLDYLRANDIAIVDVAGYYDQYIIHFDMLKSDAEMVSAEIEYLLEMHA